MIQPQPQTQNQPHQETVKPLLVNHVTQPSQTVDVLINLDAKSRQLVSLSQTHASQKTLAESKLLESRSLSAMPPDLPPESLPPSLLPQPSEVFDYPILII